MSFTHTVEFLIINFRISNFRNKAFMMLTRLRTVQVPANFFTVAFIGTQVHVSLSFALQKH